MQLLFGLLLLFSALSYPVFAAVAGANVKAVSAGVAAKAGELLFEHGPVSFLSSREIELSAPSSQVTGPLTDDEKPSFLAEPPTSTIGRWSTQMSSRRRVFRIWTQDTGTAPSAGDRTGATA
jgi:hypothetical protein